MQTVKHKNFGKGEVISKEVKNDTTIVTVKFENGKESRFSIPESFTIGIVEAEGTLKDEVDAAIVAQKTRFAEKLKQESLNQNNNTTTIARRGTTTNQTITYKNPLEIAYEQYLLDKGYQLETGSGSDSTVPIYVKSVKSILNEENVTWETLKDKIDDIVPKYDVGGTREKFGSKSNRTPINALKRFQDYIKTL